jgi:uncharacterized membrane protein YjjP (DUF1212 family)
MTPRELVPVAADWGAVLLASGAEIRQVEEGLYALFASHGHRAEVFVLLKGIFLSAWEPGGEPVSLIRHVRGGSGVDLARLERGLKLQTTLAQGDLGADEARQSVDALAASGPRRGWVLTAAAAATAGLYALFFGGTVPEALWATALAAAVQGLRLVWSGLRVPALADVFLSAVLLALGALAAPLLLAGADPVRVLTGGVMILIPGVALVNGIKDILHGDTVSSLYRLAEAGLQTAAIAAGAALVLTWGWPHG